MSTCTLKVCASHLEAKQEFCGRWQRLTRQLLQVCTIYNDARDVLQLIADSVRAPNILSVTGQEQSQKLLPSCHLHHLPDIPFLRLVAELDPCDMGKL